MTNDMTKGNPVKIFNFFNTFIDRKCISAVI